MAATTPATTTKKSRKSKSATADATPAGSSVVPAAQVNKTDSTAMAPAPAPSNNMAAPSTTASKSSTHAASTASSSDIAAAQSSGKVWVNTESGVYHKSGRWYGKTKQGKFMTEAEAKAAGYKEAAKE